MDLNLIKKLIKILESSDVTDLEIEENGTRVKLAKKVRVTQAVSYTQAAAASPVTHQISETVSKAEDKKVVDEHAGMHEIKSPIVGTFYRAPAPDADSYVQVGDMVSAGSVLCIVEAMKLMNEIESDVSGKIVKILVENGNTVKYNKQMFLIQIS